MVAGPGRVVLLQERILGGEVDQHIVNQFLQDRIEGGVAFFLAERLVKLIYGVKQLLMLLVKDSKVHAIRTQSNGKCQWRQIFLAPDGNVSRVPIGQAH